MRRAALGDSSPCSPPPPFSSFSSSSIPTSANRSFFCKICNSYKDRGFMYHCSSSCRIYLDIRCAQLPLYTSAGNLVETLHFSHPHPLISSNPNGHFECMGCFNPIEEDDASSACFECKTFFHKKCLELPSTINHPCHRTHQLQLAFNDPGEDNPECNLCQSSIRSEFYNRSGFYYGCVPCKFYIHSTCAWPPPIIEDKSHHEHPFTLLSRPNDSFYCNACGEQGDHVSYICSTCNFQVHKDCVSLPRHIKLTLHPHPISHCFFLRIDHHDSRTWDCMICYQKVNIEHGSYYCSQPGCDFIIHVKCSIRGSGWYNVVEVENPNVFEEFPSSIIRVIKEIKVEDVAIAAEIKHVSHEHNLILLDKIKDNKYCNGCVLPILSAFYYCSHCDFFLHKTCAELPRRIQPWFVPKPCNLHTDRIFRCFACKFHYCGFSYKLHGFEKVRLTELCLRCASRPHGFTYHADEPHFLFFVEQYEGNCNACGIDLSGEQTYKCKDCTFALDWRCVALPDTVWHKCDQHSLKLAYQDRDDYLLRHYCDICEEKRDPEKWFYHCETCDNATHFECVPGVYPFIKAGSKYTYEGHPHPLTFVRKIYYYPECIVCGEPCRDMVFECVEHGCKYIVHWSCITRDFPYSVPLSDSESESDSE